MLGTGLGLFMGYYRGAVDDVTGRFVEAFLALPLVVTAILGAVALGSSDGALILIIGIIFTPLIARTVRAAVLQERDLDYVAATRLRGESSFYIMFAEILPNITGADHRRVHRPPRLRGVHAGDPLVPGLRTAAADPELGL